MNNKYYAHYIITPYQKTIYQIIRFGISDLVPENEDSNDTTQMLRLNNPDCKIYYSSDMEEFKKVVGRNDVLFVQEKYFPQYTLHNA